MKPFLFSLFLIFWNSIETGISSCNNFDINESDINEKAFQNSALQQYQNRDINVKVKSFLKIRKNSGEIDWRQDYTFFHYSIEQITDYVIPETIIEDFLNLKRFKSVSIKGGKLSPKILRDLGSCHYLYKINFTFVPLHFEDLKILFNHRQNCFLKSLTLNFNSLKDEELSAFKDALFLTGLKNLDLSDNPITNQGLNYLAQNSCLTSLKTLNLSFTNITFEGLSNRVMDTLFRFLIELNLNSTYLKDEGALRLAHYNSLPHLKNLHVNDAFIEKKGANALLKSPFLKALEYLELSCNPFSDSGQFIFFDSQ